MADPAAGAEAGREPPSRAMIALTGVVFVAAVVFAVVLATRHGEEPLPPPEPAAAVGFSNNAVAQGIVSAEEAARRLAQAGADIDRVQIDWATLEPSPGARDFSVYDQIYADDLQAGIEPLFVFAYAPAWAGNGACDALLPSCHVAPAPEHYDDAARTVADIVRRYPEAAGIEIWNEPNAAYFWAPAADPAAYAELLEAAARAVERVDPEMPILGGSTSSGAAMGRPGFLSPANFIDAIYANGAADSLDVLSIHVYPQPGDNSGATAVDLVTAIRAVQRAHADDAPLWVTETGISTTGSVPVSQDEQAAGLPQLVAGLAGLEGVEAVLVHTLFGGAGDPADPAPGFAVIDPAGEPLQAFCALAESWRGSGC